MVIVPGPASVLTAPFSRARSGPAVAPVQRLEDGGPSTARSRVPSATSSPAPDPQVVGDDVLAEPLTVGLEHAAAGPGGDVVDEVDQRRLGVEGEDVQRGAGAGDPLDLGNGAGDRLGHRRPAEV